MTGCYEYDYANVIDMLVAQAVCLTHHLVQLYESYL